MRILAFDSLHRHLVVAVLALELKVRQTTSLIPRVAIGFEAALSTDKHVMLSSLGTENTHGVVVCFALRPTFWGQLRIDNL